MTSKKELLKKKIGMSKANKKNKSRIVGYIIELLRIEREVEENNSKSSTVKHKFPTKKDKLQVDFPVRVIDYFKLCNNMGQPMGICYRCGYAIKHTYILKDSSGFQFALGTTCIDRFDKESGDHIPNPEDSVRYQVGIRAWKRDDEFIKAIKQKKLAAKEKLDIECNKVEILRKEVVKWIEEHKNWVEKMEHPKFGKSRNHNMWSHLEYKNFFTPIKSYSQIDSFGDTLCDILRGISYMWENCFKGVDLYYKWRGYCLKAEGTYGYSKVYFLKKSCKKKEKELQLIYSQLYNIVKGYIDINGDNNWERISLDDDTNTRFLYRYSNPPVEFEPVGNDKLMPKIRREDIPVPDWATDFILFD